MKIEKFKFSNAGIELDFRICKSMLGISVGVENQGDHAARETTLSWNCHVEQSPVMEVMRCVVMEKILIISWKFSTPNKMTF